MKKKYLTLIALSLLYSAHSQEQNVVSSAGEMYNNGTNTVEFTIGESVISTVSNGTNDLTQGFHQTKLSVVAIDEIKTELEISVFPNPVVNQLSVHIDKVEQLNYQIYNLEGRLLQTEDIYKNSTLIDVSNYPPGAYFLRISSKNEVIKSYKIIKQ